MMSEPKRLHPIMILLTIIKSIKEVIIPIGVYFFIFFFKDPSDNVWLRWSPYFLIALLLLFILGTSFIKWVRYTYRIEHNELRIEHGLFVKKKRYIPFERIQSLDFSETILHRPLGLVKVTVETAAGSADEAEADMTAIKKEEATAIRKMIAEAKSTGELPEERENPDTEETEEKGLILYKITRKQLLFFASTSGRAGVIIAAIAAFAGQFADVIPLDKIFNEMADIVKTGFLFISLLVLAALFIAWLLSVAWAYLKYNDFTLRLVDDELVITRGLLEKRTTTIPVRRIQALKISESLFRQPFGYASVSVEYAGGSIIDENKSDDVLIPIVKKREIPRLLQAGLSDYRFEEEFHSAPKRAQRRYFFVKTLIMTLITIGLSIWLWPYGLLAILLIGLTWIWGIFQYQSAAWKLTGHQLVLRYRDIQQHTVYLQKNRIQSLDYSVNWFQKRAHLATIATFVMSRGGGVAVVKHLEAEDAREIYNWYLPNTSSRQDDLKEQNPET